MNHLKAIVCFFTGHDYRRVSPDGWDYVCASCRKRETYDGWEARPKGELGRIKPLHQAEGRDEDDVIRRDAPCVFCGKPRGAWLPGEECPRAGETIGEAIKRGDVPCPKCGRALCVSREGQVSLPCAFCGHGEGLCWNLFARTN